jgi:hypothetical protein
VETKVYIYQNKKKRALFRGGSQKDLYFTASGEIAFITALYNKSP